MKLANVVISVAYLAIVGINSRLLREWVSDSVLRSRAQYFIWHKEHYSALRVTGSAVYVYRRLMGNWPTDNLAIDSWLVPCMWPACVVLFSKLLLTEIKACPSHRRFISRQIYLCKTHKVWCYDFYFIMKRNQQFKWNACQLCFTLRSE